MEDRIEQIDLQDLQGMTKPEEFLWDPQSMPDQAPSLEDLPPIAPQAPEMAEPELLNIKTKRLRSKIPIIPQRTPANYTTPLSPGEVAMVNQRLRQQPFVWASVKKIQRNSEIAYRLGWILAIIVMAGLLAIGAKSYLEGLENIPGANLPNFVDKALGDSSQDLQIPEAIALAAAGLLPLLMMLSIAFTLITSLRAILLRRPMLAVGAVLAGVSAAFGILSFLKDSDNLHSVSVCLIMLGLLLGARVWENILHGITRIRLRSGAKRGA